MKMAFIVILFIFIDLTLAKNPTPIRGCAAKLLPEDFEQCSLEIYSDNCIPFPPLINLNWASAKFGLRVLIGQLNCNAVTNNMDLPSDVFFNVYNKEKLARVVSAGDFLKNPHQYVRKSSPCVRFLVGGWTSSCSTEPSDVPKEYNWLTYAAESLNCRTKCDVIVVNWGKISGNDYACLAGYMLKPMGDLIGCAAMKLKPSCRVSISGHSLGAHIAGFAGRYVISKGGLIEEIAAYDAAGPLIKNNDCLWQVGLFECGMGKYVAKRTLSYVTNPSVFGTANKDTAQINVLCNEPLYNQPGFTLSDPVYNHNFAGMLMAALSAGAKCFASNSPKINLNHNDNSYIPSGTYYLSMCRCFPFCCNVS